VVDEKLEERNRELQDVLELRAGGAL
jgi:hypothetical protein